jgi:CelD/BcsL family acetyltransferase involved in cellulose biosynthesis
MGWKGDAKSSIQSNPGHDAFFREMAMAFLQHRRGFFTELLLGDQIIASTFNIISGNVGFAFKLSWDPTYAKMSPGIMNELELISRAPSLCGHLAYIDSCTGRNSFMEKIWPGRQRIASGAFATGPARHLLSATDYLRSKKQQLRKFIKRITAKLPLAFPVALNELVLPPLHLLEPCAFLI